MPYLNLHLGMEIVDAGAAQSGTTQTGGAIEQEISQ